MITKKYIVWDWNGTIIDDVGIALDAVNDMLREKKRLEITLEQYRQAMDTPILRFYERFFDMEETDLNRKGVIRLFCPPLQQGS